MVTRFEALEGKIPECESFRVDLGALLSELVVMNFNVKVLIEAMVSNLKQTQDNIQNQSKVDGDKTLASSTPDVKTLKTSPSSFLSPSTKYNGSHKDNTCQASDALVLERSHSNIQMQSGTQSKEIFRALSPPSLDMSVQIPVSIAVRLSSVDKDATTVDERADGSMSPNSDCAFISPLNKGIIAAPETKKRTTSIARGKTIANRTTLDVGKTIQNNPKCFSSCDFQEGK